MKTCTGCCVIYPATRECFYAEERNKDGLQSRCKVCCRKTAREYRQSDKVKRLRRGYQCKRYGTINGYLRGIYASMKQRCTRPKCSRYKDYGGRGIELKFTSDEFVDYVIRELQVDPKGLQIDRIDNDGHYEPGNIRFVTRTVNCNNKRNSKK